MFNVGTIIILNWQLITYAKILTYITFEIA